MRVCVVGVHAGGGGLATPLTLLLELLILFDRRTISKLKLISERNYRNLLWSCAEREEE